MAFRKLEKPSRTYKTSAPTITFATGSNGTIYLAFNRGAVQALGDPKAVHFEVDDEAALLRIVATPADDPAAYKLGQHARLSVTGMIRDLGLEVRDTTRIPLTRDGRLAVIADLSALPVAAPITPIRRVS